MTLVEIQLPRLAGTREAARDLVEHSGIHGVTAPSVFLSARLLTTGTISFADELVRSLQAAGAQEITLAGAPNRFEHLLKAAAARRNYPALHIASPDDLLAV